MDETKQIFAFHLKDSSDSAARGRRRLLRARRRDPVVWRSSNSKRTERAAVASAAGEGVATVACQARRTSWLCAVSGTPLQRLGCHILIASPISLIFHTGIVDLLDCHVHSHTDLHACTKKILHTFLLQHLHFFVYEEAQFFFFIDFVNNGSLGDFIGQFLFVHAFVRTALETWLDWK